MDFPVHDPEKGGRSGVIQRIHPIPKHLDFATAPRYPHRVFRLFLAIIPLVTGASAQLHTLGPGRDLNEIANLSHFVLIKWMGGTDNHVIGIDVAKKRLPLAQYHNLNKNWLPQEVTLLGTLREGVSRGATLVTADTDGDGFKDVILLEGDDAYSWTSSGRFSSGPWTAPVHMKLPVPLETDNVYFRPTPPEIHDLDGDGQDDLLIPPQIGSYGSGQAPTAGGVIFSFGREDSQWIPFDLPGISGVFVGPAWSSGLTPTLSLAVSDYTAGDLAPRIFNRPSSLHPLP